MIASDTPPPLDFVTRIWFAWVCYFRVLFDGQFAARAWAAREPAEPPARELREPPPPSMAAPVLREARRDRPASVEERAVKQVEVQLPREKRLSEEELAGLASQSRVEGALGLLSLLQAEGRFVDFLQQDIASFDDTDVGTAARVVHEGCRRALKDRVKVEPVRSEKEGAVVEIQEGFDARSVKLSGNVAGAGPFKGTLRHKGWRATSVKLPDPTKHHVHEILCPAEVEL